MIRRIPAALALSAALVASATAAAADTGSGPLTFTAHTDQAEFTVGEAVSYTLTLTNTGDIAQAGVALHVPPGLVIGGCNIPYSVNVHGQSILAPAGDDALGAGERFECTAWFTPAEAEPLVFEFVATGPTQEITQTVETPAASITAPSWLWPAGVVLAALATAGVIIQSRVIRSRDRG